MTNQTDHERGRILDAHDTMAQEAYWGGEADTDEPDPASDDITEWAMRKSRAVGRCDGLTAAYDVLKDRLTQADRELLLDMAHAALTGSKP